MRIRPAVPADYSAIATVAVKVHVDDAEMAFFCPGRDAHPKAYHRFFTLRVRNYAMIEQCFVIVAETEPSDSCWEGKTQIVGYSLWSREGDSKATRQRWRTKKSLYKSSYPNHKTIRDCFLRLSDFSNTEIIHRFLSSMFMYYMIMFFNPAGSLIHNLQGGDEDSQFFDPNYKDPEETWWPNEIAVDPKFQKRGIGKLLLKWGMGHAREENVPVALASTPAGLALYKSAGFQQVGTWKWYKHSEEVYSLMRWDPPSLQ
jgi:GNAT superfamily N-acetyltransferase